MNRLAAALPRALAFVALGSAVLIACAWVIEPLFDSPEPGLFGARNFAIREDLFRLVRSDAVPEDQWSGAEVSARFALILSVISCTSLLARWRCGGSPDTKAARERPRIPAMKWSVITPVLLLIVASAAYPVYLVRRAIELAAIQHAPVQEDPLPNFPQPPPLDDAEREAMGKEISPAHPNYLWMVTVAGVLPQWILNCPVHGKPLRREAIPHIPRYPKGNMVREGFPFGQLAMTDDLCVLFRQWHADRCSDCVALHERFIGVFEAELGYVRERMEGRGVF
jgi:hypothetical protein